MLNFEFAGTDIERYSESDAIIGNSLKSITATESSTLYRLTRRKSHIGFGLSALQTAILLFITDGLSDKL